MYNYYGIYASCRDAAWRCLLDFDVHRLPVKLLSAAQRAGIRVMRNSDVSELRENESGASIYTCGRWIIVYDDTLPVSQSRMVLAHELGHILLGHEYKYLSYRFLSEDRKLKSEHEADLFAVRLLAPACVLHELGATSSEDIVELCDIPDDVARQRAQRMKVLEKRSKFYQSELEKRVVNNFSEFIESRRQDL